MEQQQHANEWMRKTEMEDRMKETPGLKQREKDDFFFMWSCGIKKKETIVTPVSKFGNWATS